MLILAAEGSEARTDELTNSHFQSKLLKRVKLHYNNDICVVPLSSICGPCFVLYNKDNCTTQDVISTGNITAYNFRSQYEWCIFMNSIHL